MTLYHKKCGAHTAQELREGSFRNATTLMSFPLETFTVRMPLK